MQKTTVTAGCLLRGNRDADAVAIFTNTSKFIALSFIAKSALRKKMFFFKMEKKGFSLRNVKLIYCK